MKIKSRRGGARPGAGAKPKADPVEPVTYYIRKSKLEKHGGKAAFRNATKELLENYST